MRDYARMPAERIEGKAWYEDVDPDLSALFRGLKQPGLMVTWIMWMAGVGMTGEGVTAEELAKIRGAGIQSTNKQLIKAHQAGLIQFNLKTNRFRLSDVIPNMEGKRISRVWRPPTHVGEFIRCEKCMEVSRYVGMGKARIKGTQEIVDVRMYAHGAGRLGLKDPESTICRARVETESGDGWV